MLELIIERTTVDDKIEFLTNKGFILNHFVDSVDISPISIGYSLSLEIPTLDYRRYIGLVGHLEKLIPNIRSDIDFEKELILLNFKEETLDRIERNLDLVISYIDKK